jgi:hypothetical protein
MRAKLDDFVDEAHVISKIIFLVRIQHITAVTNGRLHDAARLAHGLDSDFELVNVVKGVKNPEYIHTIPLGMLAEVVNGVIRQSIRSEYDILKDISRGNSCYLR